MKKNFYRRLVLAVCILLVCQKISAQQHQITGTVKDKSGMTMPGVNVIVKGTTQGTTTDSNGAFVIEAPAGEVLIFSFIGSKSQEIVTTEQTRIEVVLEEDVATLDEVVVIGYGSVQRKDVTGSISSVKGEDLKRANTTTLEQALQGRVPGLVVQQVSGQPGGGVSVQIRGITSLGGSSPLKLT